MMILPSMILSFDASMPIQVSTAIRVFKLEPAHQIEFYDAGQRKDKVIGGKIMTGGAFVNI